MERKDANGKCLLTVTLTNPTTNVAVMAHVQLRRKHSGQRVLPVFYTNNYISLVPNESKTFTVEADLKDLGNEDALLVLDGWNTTVAPTSAAGVSIAPNVEADPAHSPVTGLPLQTSGLR